MTIADLIAKERERQEQTVNLIASENYPSNDVVRALSSEFTVKYSEGYPGKRYYAGNSVVDELETQVIELARKVFNTNYHVNVQAYSGSIANLAVYFAALNPGDTTMGLELSHGGHLTHGHPVTISGKLYKRIPYHLDESTFLLDYEEIERLANEHRPKMLITGASAYSRQIDFERLSRIAHSVGALHLADISHISGFVAAGLHPTPFGNADFVMTTTHKLLRGPRGALVFCKDEWAKKLDASIFPGIQGGPHMNNIAAIGVCLEEALSEGYIKYVEMVQQNAKALSSELSKQGMTVISGGTDNHLMLIDLRPLGISGQDAQDRLEQAGIITNKNSIPFDNASPQNPSGLRLGTPAITTRGMKGEDVVALGKKISQLLLKN